MNTIARFGLAAALLAGTALSSTAQTQDSTATQPKVQQTAPSTNSATSAAPGQTKGDGANATATAPGQQQKSGAAESAADAAPGQVKPMKDGQADAAKADKPKADGTAATDAASGTAKQDAGKQDAGKQDATKDQASGSGQTSTETTSSINISAEQKTEIRTVIQETKVAPARLDISVNVGVVVPTTVEFHPLPSRIVTILPQYRGYEYFVLADGRIVIVEPVSHKVVYIVVA